MTGLEIYNLAADLLACKNPDGSSNPDCTDYVSRAPALLSILLAENIRLDRLLRNDRSARPLPVSSLDDELECHEILGHCVLPYGLASLLVADESPEMAQRLYRRYLMSIETVRGAVAAVFNQIGDCYAYHG